MTAETSIGPELIEDVVIRFAGDSGDGMQIAGDRFTDASAIFGNDLATLPNFPAEIRAPAGTIAGVSSFQVHISDHDIVTPGDAPNVLVAMNPAALKANLAEMPPGSTLLVNSDAFDDRNLGKVGYDVSPLDDGSLSAYRVIQVPMTSLTLEACKELGVKPRDAERSKNFFAVGLISWMYTRPVDPTLEWIDQKYGSRQIVVDANVAAFKAGLHFGETAELAGPAYQIPPAALAPGRYRNISGNPAIAYGLLAAAQHANLPILYASYPITPASDILHELSSFKNFGVRTLQAEDEIAAIGVAIGAAFAGQLGVTATSGPGRRPQERGSRPRGEPRAPAAAHRRAARWPVHRVCPPRPSSPTSCSRCTGVTVKRRCRSSRRGRRATASRSRSRPPASRSKYRTPVIILTDGYVANGAEPWLLPDLDALPDISVPFAEEPNHGDDFWPYLRDPETLARPWAIPGTPGLMHRIGGLEKEDGTGIINYDPENHDFMVRIRAAKVAGIANDIPPVDVDTQGDADVLVLGWGSTWGSISESVRRVRAAGQKVDHAHLVHLNPFPADLGEVLGRYSKVLVPEMNLGQLSRLVRAEYLVDAVSLTQVRGVPFTAAEIEAKILEMLG